MADDMLVPNFIEQRLRHGEESVPKVLLVYQCYFYQREDLGAGI